MMMINRVRETMLGAALAVGLTGCASAEPFVGPSSHDATGLRALLADRVEVAYDVAGRGWGLRVISPLTKSALDASGLV